MEEPKLPHQCIECSSRNIVDIDDNSEKCIDCGGVYTSK